MKTELTKESPPYDFNNSIMLCFLAPSASARGCHEWYQSQDTETSKMRSGN